jgi:DNA recombination protein Rad52
MFSEAQARLLAGKLSEKVVRTRTDQGRVLSYIEGWHAIAEANRIFGFEGWDRETVSAECIWQDSKREPKACAYTARVRIRVRAGDTIVSRDGSGVGHGKGATLGEAHESALKEAETDATKRALATFGNLFGLALYDKEQNGVRRRANGNGCGVAGGISWALLSSTGALLRRLGTPEEFCAAMREAIEKTPTPDRLKALWARNAPTITHLLKGWPDLRTVNGTHYTEVLERLYRDQAERLVDGGQENTGHGSAGAVDKSDLSLGAPKRLRDPEHLQFVGSLPCLVCARTPSQAHHLRFAQPRALGSKVSDEWTVPLCILHHRALHDFGAEEKWWEQMGINALAEAEKLWAQSHGRPQDVATAGPSAEAPAGNAA